MAKKLVRIIIIMVMMISVMGIYCQSSFMEVGIVIVNGVVVAPLVCVCVRVRSRRLRAARHCAV